MGSMDRSSSRVLRNNKNLLCSVLDASEILPEAAARGLVSGEENDEIWRCETPTAKFLEVLLERRRSVEIGTSRSPIRKQQARNSLGAGRHSRVEQDGNAFNILLEVLEMKEEYRAWAKYLKDERELMEAQLALDDSEEMQEGEMEDDMLLKGGQGSREFRGLARLSQNVDLKVKNIRTDVVKNESQVSLPQQQLPLSNSAKLLKEFNRTTRISERDVRLLLNLYNGHCDVKSVRDSSVKSLLHIAAERMGFRVVKMMIEDFNFDSNDRDLYGNTPLHIACLCQKTQTVMYLLSMPHCDPNIQNEDGMTPLHLCARMGSDAVTKHLFNCRRVDKNLKDYEGKTAVEIMDETGSKLVRGNIDHMVSQPKDQCDSEAELGLVRGTEILVKHKKLHTLLVSKNPKWQLHGDQESYFMPAETETNKYDIAPFSSEDIVLRNKEGCDGRKSAVHKRKKTREERLHSIVLQVDLWRYLCFLLVSIFVGVVLCISLAVLLILRNPSQ